MLTKGNMWSTLGLGFAVLLLGPLPVSATPTLIGDSITGSIHSPGGMSITTQLTSPQTVGSGIEFTGRADDVFGQIWDVFVDVGASEFRIGWTETTRSGDGNINFGGPGFGLSLSSLDFSPPASISGVLNSSYVCSGSVFACNTFVGSGIQGLSFTADSINVDFETLRSGEVYTFAISSAVPEPGTLALLGFGLAGLGLRRRRKAA
jgi:hypothetical protein